MSSDQRRGCNGVLECHILRDGADLRPIGFEKPFRKAELFLFSVLNSKYTLY